MDLTKISIKRPISIIMAMFIVIILGFVSLTKMELALMPDMDLPYAIIITQYNNAGPEEVENLITEPIENAISNVENIKNIYSVSYEGMSVIEIEFGYGNNMDKSLNDLRDRIDMIEDYLPDDAGSSSIMKINMDSMPIAYVVVASEQMNAYELKKFAENNIENRLERQKGVASVDISGGVEKEIKVELNPEKIEGLGIDISTIAQILSSENTNLSAGVVDYGEKSLTISSKLRMKNIDDVKNTPIRLNSSVSLSLKDIAQVSEDLKKVNSISRYNGEACVLLSVTKASDGNTVNAVNSVKKEVEKLSEEFLNMSIKVVYESGSIIEKSINNVIGNIFTAAVLSIFILLIFLKNIGLTAVIAVSMPLSIIGTFVLLYFSGTTLNMVSLGGLSIGVGMLVDNSIVVLENIYRYRTSLGYEKIRGTYLGAKEVTTAITASTLTTIVVFIPFVFTQGLVLQLMKDLALSVVFSLIMSLVVAMTVVPMLAGNYVDNVHRNKGIKGLGFVAKLMDIFDKFIKKLISIYEKVLNWAVYKKKRVLLLSLLISILSMGLIPFIGMDFFPQADEGVFNIVVKTPKGTKLSEVDKYSLKVEEYLNEIPELESYTVRMLGSSGGIESVISGGSEKSNIQVRLVNKNYRTKSTKDIMEEVRNTLSNMAGIKADLSLSSSMNMGGGNGGITLMLYGDDIGTLERISKEFVNQIENIEGTRQVKSSVEEESNQIALTFDRDKIRQYGLTGYQVATQIKNTMDGLKATTLKSQGKEIDIRIVYAQNENTTLTNLEDVKILTPSGTYIPMSSLVKSNMSDIQSSINRANQTRFVTITSDVYNRDLGSVSRDIQSLISQINLPEGYWIAFGGTTEMMNETFSSLMLVILLAIVLVYMVMAGQFESLINPFIIMFTIPLAFSGAWILLFIFRESISVMALIGALVLVGIVVNNGIVLIEYIGILRDRDKLSAVDAVLKACPTRLRPILMTALTTILGQLPLIFSRGDNSEMLRGMGLLIAGGLTTSTLLTLLVIPLMYLVFDKISDKFSKKFKKKRRLTQSEIEMQCTLWSQEDKK